MHEDIEKIYHFDNYIYTLYQEGYRGDPQQFEEYAQFCALHDIDVITMNEEYYSDELLDYLFIINNHTKAYRKTAVSFVSKRKPHYPFWLRLAIFFILTDEFF